MTTLLFDEPVGGPPLATLLMAHGAGAGPQSRGMIAFAAAAARAGVRVVRFPFAYVEAASGRKPPPRIPLLVPEFGAALATVLPQSDGPVLIGGKSMGSRVACRLAGTVLDPRVRGVFALGFPFHPPGRMEKTRLDDLAAARLPVLVCQGTKDPFGDRETVSEYALSASVVVEWFEGGDHDLKPPKATGFTQADHVAGAAAALAVFARRISSSGQPGGS